MGAPLVAVIVMSAGDGTRMKSNINKALHRIGGRTLVGHAVSAASGAGAEHVAVVVRAQGDAVAAAAREALPEIVVSYQDDVYGTGRAAECGLQALPADLHGTVIVTTGDTPLLQADTLRSLAQTHADNDAAATVITGILPDATGYGRIVRDETTGDVLAIVEHKQATEQQLEIREFNSGIFAFDADLLREVLADLGVNEAAGEKYLTDVVEIAVARGRRVVAHVLDDLVQTEGVNDKAQLAKLGREFNRRLLDKLMRESGAIVIDPETTWVDADVTVGRDTVIHPGCQLHGATTIGDNCVIGPDSTLKDAEVGDGATVVRSHVDLAVIGADANVGPYSYLRPGTELGVGGKIGGFVETKNATIGDGAKVPHLTYCGDATIGPGANIGAGTIFANYDGVTKNHTTVGAYSFVGSDSVLIAPVNIGDGAYVGAGSAVEKDVEPGQIAVARARQRNIDGWVERRREGTRTAEAARAARDAQSSSDDGTSSTDSNDVTDVTEGN